MPILPHVINVSIFPHLFSRINPKTKAEQRRKYKNLKSTGSAAVIAGVEFTEGTQLAKAILCSKLRAYGYKSFFAIAVGPAIQFISLPFYVCTYGTKMYSYVMAAAEIGAQITKGQMGIVNWVWIGADILLFGEPILITDDSDFLIIHKESAATFIKRF